MKEFNQFVEPYNKREVSWRKSVGEISKFITDHLEKPDFYDFLGGEEISQEKRLRWQVRLDELWDKITKRTGYRIDKDKLFTEACQKIIDQKTYGELNPSKNLDYFCDNVDYLIEKRRNISLN